MKFIKSFFEEKSLDYNRVDDYKSISKESILDIFLELRDIGFNIEIIESWTSSTDFKDLRKMQSNTIKSEFKGSYKLYKINCGIDYIEFTDIGLISEVYSSMFTIQNRLSEHGDVFFRYAYGSRHASLDEPDNLSFSFYLLTKEKSNLDGLKILKYKVDEIIKDDNITIKQSENNLTLILNLTNKNKIYQRSIIQKLKNILGNSIIYNIGLDGDILLRLK